MNFRYAASALCACVILAAPGSHAAPDDAQTIRQIEESWNREYAARDAVKVTAHYAADATLMGPGMAPSHGKETIGKVLKEMTADPALSLKFHASRVEIAKAGDMAYTEGTYVMTMTNPVTRQPMSDKGSYVTIYRKQGDGSWKAISDIATSENPPGAPQNSKR